MWEGVYESPLPIVPSQEPVSTVVALGPEAEGKWKIGAAWVSCCSGMRASSARTARLLRTYGSVRRAISWG